MKNKFQNKFDEPQNLRKIFHAIQRDLKSSSSSQSLEKKLSPFKKMLSSVKKSHSPSQLVQIQDLNKQMLRNLREDRKLTQENSNIHFCDNEDFVELYNNDPIFKYRLQRLFSDEMKKNGNDVFKVYKKLSLDNILEIDECQAQLRTTFKARRSQNEKVFHGQIQNYKKLLKRQNSIETNPSSQDNE